MVIISLTVAIVAARSDAGTIVQDFQSRVPVTAWIGERGMINIEYRIDDFAVANNHTVNCSLLAARSLAPSVRQKCTIGFHIHKKPVTFSWNGNDKDYETSKDLAF